MTFSIVYQFFEKRKKNGRFDYRKKIKTSKKFSPIDRNELKATNENEKTIWGLTKEQNSLG